MPQQLTFPSNAYLTQVERELIPVLNLSDPIFRIFPVVERNAWNIVWDKEDNLTGLQMPRGLDGDPERVAGLGSNQWSVKPGVYGEFAKVTEEEIVIRRQLGTFDAPIDVTDVVMARQVQLLNRRYNRLKWLGWTLLTTGSYAVLNSKGVTVHKDAFVNQTFTTAISWDTAATATPIADARALTILHRGISVSFGADAEWWMNSATFNVMAGNNNNADLAGKRDRFGATIQSVDEYNKLFLSIGVPSIQIYDEGYIDDNGVFQLWIPYGQATLVGRRTNGAPVGNIVLARNAANPNAAPGAYTRVKYVDDIPPGVIVQDGMNPAPVEWYPSSIVRCTVIH